MFDLKLGIKNQALVLLQHLSAYKYDFFGIKDRYDFQVNTAALYNCRESGIVLEVYRWASKEQLYIYFSECRSSDGIFVTTFTADRKSARINPVTIQDFPESSYEQRKYFDYAEYGKATDYIIDLVKKYVAEEYFQKAVEESNKNKEKENVVEFQ